MYPYANYHAEKPVSTGSSPLFAALADVASVLQALCVMISARHLLCSIPIVTSTLSCLYPEIY